MKKILLKNVNIIDGEKDSKILECYDLLIVDGIISKIDKNIKEDKCKIINLSNKYVMPGLINLHVHMPGSGKLTKTKAADKSGLVKLISKNNFTKSLGLLICQKYAKTELYSGVTTVRCLGGISDIDARLKNKINSGKAVGPRMIVANNAIGTKNCHMYGTVAVGASSIDEAIRLTDLQLDTGADVIKVMITGGILDTKERGNPGILKIDGEMVKAICKRAHERGAYVAAHVEGKDGMEVAIKNGVDTIEHGAITSIDNLKEFKSRGGAVVLTLSPAIPLWQLDPSVTGYSEAVQYNTSVFGNWMIDNAKACLELGIPLGLGTDTACPLVTHYDFWRELVYFKEKLPNITNQFAIYSATLGNASIAHIADKTGSIKAGKLAELLVVDGNPLDDLKALKNPYMVIKDNKIFKKKIKKMKKVDSLLDSLI